MSYSVSQEDFDSVAPGWSKLLADCPGRSVFLTPEWQRTWWRNFGSGGPLLLAVRLGGELAGVASLMRKEAGLSLLGNGDVCDYLDVVSPPAHAGGVCRALMEHLEGLDWRTFRLFSLQEHSVALEHLVPLARAKGWTVTVEQEDVCPKLDLPPTWDEYFPLLDKKKRHELRRKMRKVAALPEVSREVITSETGLKEAMDDFFPMFLDSQERKTDFLTPKMEGFFRDLVVTAAREGWLRLFFLSAAGKRVATALGFDYGDTFYLYNSGYDKEYAGHSVGLVLKAMCIEESIGSGKRVFDFLRGNEYYKYELGGRDTPVFRCLITRVSG